MPGELPYFIVALFGGLVGLSELVSRYRDSPIKATITIPGVCYILINSAAASGALFLIETYDVYPEATWLQFNKAEILALLTAGFGSMVFFRSSIFNVRVGDTEWGVGPASLLQILVDAADRACDRTRATPRSKAINEIMRGISFARASEALPTYCFGLMQNVRLEEQRAFGNIVSDLKKSEMGDSFKSLSLGLGLMNIVGEKVLRAAVAALGNKIRGPIEAELDTILSLKGLDFNRDHEALVLACRTLASDRSQRHIGGSFGSWLQKSETTILDVATEIKKDAKLDSDNKVLLLATELLERYGEAVLQAAIRVVKTVPVAALPPPAAGAGTITANVNGAQQGVTPPPPPPAPEEQPPA